jgi:hypothetical protein
LAFAALVAALMLSSCSKGEVVMLISSCADQDETPRRPARSRQIPAEARYVGGTDGGVFVECACHGPLVVCSMWNYPGEQRMAPWTSTEPCRETIDYVYASSYFDEWDGVFRRARPRP